MRKAEMDARALAALQRRILFAHSLSGMSTAHPLLARPDPYGTLVANGASLGWNDFEVAYCGQTDARATMGRLLNHERRDTKARPS